MDVLVTPGGHRAFTIADMDRMVEAGILESDERIELIAGDLVPMAAKGSRHESIKAALVLRWGRVCPIDFGFVPETGLRLDPHNYLEPDFILFSRSKRLAEVRGPDVLLAVEVADTSLDYDMHRKPLAFGVRELWVIDAARRCVHRHADAGPDGYGDIREYEPRERLKPRHAPDAFAFAIDDLEDL